MYITGRIRQAVKESLQGSSSVLDPEIIHNKIQSILTNSSHLTDAELRRIRILYNLLKTSLKEQKLASQASVLKPIKSDKPKKKVEGDHSPKVKEKVKKEKKDNEQKVRGPKRYVVFLGNLPLDVDKAKVRVCLFDRLKLSS